MELGRKGGAGSEPASGTVTIATYNVRDGRGEGEGGEEFLGIVLAARAEGCMASNVNRTPNMQCKGSRGLLLMVSTCVGTLSRSLA